METITKKEKNSEGIEKYLILDDYRFGANSNTDAEFGFRTEIVKVTDNQYYLPTGENVTHWELKIHSIHIDCEDFEEHLSGTLQFKMTSYSKKPSITDFTNHIKIECLATIKAFEASDKYVWDMPIIDWDDIQPKHVHKFIQDIHKSYNQTADFLSVYDFYRSRIYANWKWIDYMIRGGHGCRIGEIHPIGEHFLAFLEIGKYADFYE